MWSKGVEPAMQPKELELQKLEKKLIEGIKTTLETMKYHLIDDEQLAEIITQEAQLITNAECYMYQYQNFELLERKWYGDIKIDHIKAQHLVTCNLINDEIGVRFTTETIAIVTPFNEAIVIGKIVELKPFRFTEE
jgi:hypothetical protein